MGMDISTSISSQHLHPGIRAWHALEHSHKQAWRGLATKLRRPPHEGLLERRSYCPRPRFCTQWASYDRHEKLQRARCPRAHARGARPRGIASRPSSASRAGSGRGVTQNQAKNAPFRPSDSQMPASLLRLPPQCPAARIRFAVAMMRGGVLTMTACD